MSFLSTKKEARTISKIIAFCAQGGRGPDPPQIISGGGGGGFVKSRGEELIRSNFNPKNNHFSDDFPVICWYIHIMLLH